MRINLVGDISLSGDFNDTLRLNKRWLSAEVVEKLKGDIVFANLEFVLLNKQVKKDKSLNLGENGFKAIDNLKTGGFNVFSLANNHIVDYGFEGLCETIDCLKNNNIHFFGAGRNIQEALAPAIVERNGYKVAFFGRQDPMSLANRNWAGFSNAYKGGVAKLDVYELLSQIENIRGDIDLIVAYFHWGYQNIHRSPRHIHEISHKVLDGGADIIIGSHAHDIQGSKSVKNKHVFFGLGNFYFHPFTCGSHGVKVYDNRKRFTKNRKSVIAHIDYDGNNIRQSITPTIQSKENIVVVDESNLFVLKAKNKWSSENPLLFNIERRLAELKQYNLSLKDAIIQKRFKSTISLLTKGLLILITRIIKPTIV